MLGKNPGRVCEAELVNGEEYFEWYALTALLETVMLAYIINCMALGSRVQDIKKAGQIRRDNLLVEQTHGTL